MAFNKERLAQIAKPRSNEAIERAKARKQNREWLRMSQDIALCLHYYMRMSGMNQKELSEKMGVSAVYVGKLLKGGENLTLETVCKIQSIIGERVVTVARPYQSRVVVAISQTMKFSDNAVESNKYFGKKFAQDAYVVAAGDAA